VHEDHASTLTSIFNLADLFEELVRQARGGRLGGMYTEVLAEMRRYEKSVC
jgi:hypothetical protein